MTHSSKILATLLLTFMLVGCGQSGKLYLPNDPSEVQSLPSSVSLPTEEEDDEAADDDGGS
jgi:predicted small lipoprotein YifL